MRVPWLIKGEGRNENITVECVIRLAIEETERHEGGGGT